MVSIPKVVGVMSCGFLLCLGLSTAAQAGNTASAADEMKADQSNRRQGGQELQELTAVRHDASGHCAICEDRSHSELAGQVLHVLRGEIDGHPRSRFS